MRDLTRNDLGQLTLTLDDGTTHLGIVPVRAYPLGAPDEGLSLMTTDGHEVLWIDRLSALPAAWRQLLEAELAVRELTPQVTALLDYANGATAVFTGSSGEAPGTNRLEIAGDRGRLVFESRRLVITRNTVPASASSLMATIASSWRSALSYNARSTLRPILP